MSEFIRLERLGDFQEINEIMLAIDLEKLSSNALIALVRSTSSFKEQLTDWQGTYERAWMLVWKRGNNPKRLFVGMQDLSYLTK